MNELLDKSALYLICMGNAYGGAERVAYRVLSCFANDPNIKFYVNRRIAHEFNDLGVGTYACKISNINAKISGNPIAVFYYVLTALNILIEDRPKRYSIFYCNDFESLIIAIILRALRGGRIIWHVHDVYKLQNLHVRLVLKFVLQFVDHLICITNDNANRMRRLFRRNITVVPNPTRFEPRGNEDPKPKRYYNPQNIQFGYLGQITEWKRVDLSIKFVQCLNEMHNIKSTLIIGGEALFDSDRTYYKKLIHDTKHMPFVRWLGKIEDVQSFFTSIDYLLLFSDNEPFGLVLVEALSQGVPLIAQYGDGPNEIIRRPDYGFLLHSTEQVEVTRVASLLRGISPEHYIKMSTLCRAYAYDNYSIDVFQNSIRTAVAGVICE